MFKKNVSHRSFIEVNVSFNRTGSSSTGLGAHTEAVEPSRGRVRSMMVYFDL
jgi:hypothetical protein